LNKLWPHLKHVPDNCYLLMCFGLTGKSTKRWNGVAPVQRQKDVRVWREKVLGEDCLQIFDGTLSAMKCLVCATYCLMTWAWSRHWHSQGTPVTPYCEVAVHYSCSWDDATTAILSVPTIKRITICNESDEVLSLSHVSVIHAMWTLLLWITQNNSSNFWTILRMFGTRIFLTLAMDLFALLHCTLF